MRVLKAIGLAVLGVLLFLSLSVFGLALTANSTILNPRFLPDELDRLNIGELVTESFDTGNADLPAEMEDAVIRTVIRLEPQIKVQIRAANSQVSAYLLGQTGDIDLHKVLKETVLNEAFVASILNEADILALARQNLRDQLADLFPTGQRQLVRYLDQAMPSLDPWLKQQISAATGPVVDYLLGESPTLHIAIALDPVKTTLRPALRTAFLSSPPPELAGANQAQLTTVFNQYYDLAAAQIPATATIDPASLGIGPTASLTQALEDAEVGLATTRTVIGYFRLYYILLIVILAVLILGIILIHHEVKGATRDLGITFLTYGALEFAGVLIGGCFLGTTNLPGLPSAVQSWLPGLYGDFFRPLEMFSLVVAIVGLAMVIFSLVYRRRTAV